MVIYMIRMIIADDEPVIIKGIQILLDWRSLGIEIVGEYSDGAAALEGIVTRKPEIALLDINMPKMTGMDILKEISALKLSTMVIFISGFQDFNYAREALIYGAEGYLLKPIIKEELMKSLEKGIAKFQAGREVLITSEEKNEHTDIPYEYLVEIEETTYLTVLFEVIYKRKEDLYARRLIRFSIFSYIEHYLEENHKGIVFIKNDHIVGILKGTEKTAAKELLSSLLEEIWQKTNQRTGAIIGNNVGSMGQIVEEYAKCLSMQSYFFFEDQLKNLILDISVPVFLREIKPAELTEAVKQLEEAMTRQEEEEFAGCYDRLVRLICLFADGKKEDACFHFYNVLRSVEEWYNSKGLEGLKPDMKQILEEGRNSLNYADMAGAFKRYLEQYMQRMKNLVVSNEKKDILKAMEYIEFHYMENLTLEVLAGIVHMNASYFSTFFKKNANQNFKDYLSNVRLEHAIPLLLSTDYKVYDIATRVGFRDARSFTELFIKKYGETPANYRKRIGRGN